MCFNKAVRIVPLPEISVLAVAAGSFDAEGKRKRSSARNTIRRNTELLSRLQMNSVMVVVGRRGNESWPIV
jgi:hypothetical protein